MFTSPSVMDTELNRTLLRISIAGGAEKNQDVDTSLIQNWKNEQGKSAKRAKLRLSGTAKVPRYQLREDHTRDKPDRETRTPPTLVIEQ